jgi:hypothetical protein
MHSPVGEGEGGCYLYGPEDLLDKKRELHINYHQKHAENDIFNEYQTSLLIFFAFLIF